MFGYIGMLSGFSTNSEQYINNILDKDILSNQLTKILAVANCFLVKWPVTRSRAKVNIMWVFGRANQGMRSVTV